MTVGDVSNAENFTDLLKPLKTMTVILCDQKNPTISLIHPLMASIKQACGPKDDDTTMVKDMKSAIFKNISKRYTDQGILDMIQICTALDPRFLALSSLEDDRRNEVYDMLSLRAIGTAAAQPLQQITVKCEPQPGPSQTTANQQLHVPLAPLLPELPGLVPVLAVVKQEPTSDSEPTTCSDSDEPPEKKTALEDLFGCDILITGESHNEQESIASRVEDEISRYKREIPIPLKDSAFEWWRRNSVKYPLLARLARCYLAIPGTSVPSERVFSTAGDIVTAQRASLAPENVNMLVFLSKNIKY